MPESLSTQWVECPPNGIRRGAGTAGAHVGTGFDRRTHPTLVLDTNIVLDWLVFDDPDVAAVRAAIMTGRARWIASPAMRDELETVLARGTLLQRRPDVPGIRVSWQRWADIISPRSISPAANLRCTDADDQKFIDLALQVGAQDLVTRDHAVLRLARRAQVHGLDILTGSAWRRKYAG